MPFPAAHVEGVDGKRQSASSRARALPWSLKLVLVVSTVTALGVAWRLLGIATPPLNSTDGVEAMHAALANLLAGRVQGVGATGWLPVPPPWQGPLPADPGAGIPVFTWLTSSVLVISGWGDWVGRAIAIAFSAMAGLLLFALVRELAGARAGLYSLLLYSFAPLSVILGQQYSPASLVLVAQAIAVLGMVRWHRSISDTRPQGSWWAFLYAVLSGVVASLIDPGSIFLTLPVAYLVVQPPSSKPAMSIERRLNASHHTFYNWRTAWERSPHKGKLVAYAAVMAGTVLLWSLFAARSGNASGALQANGGFAGLAALLGGSTYVQLIGLTVEKLVGVAGLVLLLAGLLHGARGTARLFLHAWLAGALLHVLADAGRIGRYEDALLPLVLPVCALVGIGASWAGSLPTRIWLAVVEQRHESDNEYMVSPHTAWLLDLPEAPIERRISTRPQARPSLGKSIAARSRSTFAALRRTWLLTLGHLSVVSVLVMVALSNWQAVYVRLQLDPAAAQLYHAGREVSSSMPQGAHLIVAGPHAAELFYASGRTGRALPSEQFDISTVQALRQEGAAYLLTVDQEWLGRHPDYIGLLTNYSVKKLSHNYILFDLNTRPASNDRLYFLETGHTLGGEFRRFWETHGGVRKLGYPISEELQEVSPDDGQTRTVQYFERAVLEYHPEYAGTPHAVMLAPVGRWVTRGKDFPRVAPFENTPDRVYFPQTGHSLKEEFLKFWQREGGLALFGYPISEELPEINPADGKVYTVQYFERARFEWHPTEAGTPGQVQLGLVGKQALEMRRR